MNEDKLKIRIGRKGERAIQGGWQSYWIKPSGKFLKRIFNKKVRNGGTHKRGNWFEWS